MAATSVTFQYGIHPITIETGVIAKQATSSVMISMGDTMVLVTVVGIPTNPGSQVRDFFPLTVHYQERHYATGKIPSGFIKRESRPSIKETLVSRLIDRPIRPMFPEEFTCEVQIVATVMSLDPQIDADIPAMLGAFAALAISGMPCQGPLGAAKVGYIEGNYILNPTKKQLETSQLDLVIAGTEQAVLMVESEAKELSEEIMLHAVLYGHDQMQIAIQAIKEFAHKVNAQPWSWQAPSIDSLFAQQITDFAKTSLTNAYLIADKNLRRDALAEVRKLAKEKFIVEDSSDEVKAALVKVLNQIESDIVRQNILDGKPRIDGRDLQTIRPITIQTGVFPRTHGSANFTRGETQALVIATLGTEKDGQVVDGITGEYRESFILHYNFPPYCVGEVGMMGSPKRREIGHGNLARRALNPVMPDLKDFPYTVRVVSEITESNGSSSMASVCGGCLALMDAGVPIKTPVAGIAMGLIKEGDKYAVLSDILGDEDHLGDMDFKVAGSARGITALQMDIKISGITSEIMKVAIDQAKNGRLHILGIMTATLAEPRPTISEFAPRITIMQINPEKIKDVIGKGGVVIRDIIEKTGVAIDIGDNGIIKIAAVGQEAAAAAQKRINDIIAEAEVDKIYEGKVVKITDFGAFVNILPGQDGLLHISQIANERIMNVSDKLSEGQTVRVKVLEIDRQGKIRLSMKAIAAGE